MVGRVVDGQVVDANGNVVGQVVNGRAVDSNGNVIGEVEKVVVGENGRELQSSVEVVRDAEVEAARLAHLAAVCGALVAPAVLASAPNSQP